MQFITVNPYKPGSEEWHRHNLGIKPGVIGQVELVDFQNGVTIFHGWFWGPVPPTMAGWWVDFSTLEAKLIDRS